MQIAWPRLRLESQSSDWNLALCSRPLPVGPGPSISAERRILRTQLRKRRRPPLHSKVDEQPLECHEVLHATGKHLILSKNLRLGIDDP